MFATSWKLTRKELSTCVLHHLVDKVIYLLFIFLASCIYKENFIFFLLSRSFSLDFIFRRVFFSCFWIHCIWKEKYIFFIFSILYFLDFLFRRVSSHVSWQTYHNVLDCLVHIWWNFKFRKIIHRWCISLATLCCHLTTADGFLLCI